MLNRIVRRLLPIAAVAALCTSAYPQFSTSVLVPSAPQQVLMEVPGNEGVELIDVYVTGPGARFFEINYADTVTTTFFAGGVPITITFNPTVLPANGQPFQATVVADVLVCSGTVQIVPAPGKAHPENTCSNGGFHEQLVEPVTGTVTGSLPSVGPQAQFSPTLPVPYIAQPANLYSMALDKSGNLYAGTAAQVLESSGGAPFIAIAGTGTAGYSGDGGPALNAQLNGVDGLLLAPSGDLIVSDSGNEVVRTISGGNIKPYMGTNLPYADNLCEYTYNGGRVGVEYLGCFAGAALFGGGPGLGSAQGDFLDGPGTIGTDGASVFIADTSNCMVRIETPLGYSAIYAGFAENTQGTGFTQYPYQSILFCGDAGDGNLAAHTGYVADAQYDPSASGQLSGPRDLAVDPAANLLIGEGGTIRMVAPTGIITTLELPTESIQGPNGGIPLSEFGMAMDHLGELFLLDTDDVTIDKVLFDSNRNPVSRTPWATVPSGVGRFIMGNNGEIWLSDGTNIDQIGSQGSLIFSGVDPGDSASLTETITNTGDSNLVFSGSETVLGPNANQYAVVTSPTDCSVVGTVASGGTCTVTVSFTPTGTGSSTAYVSLTSNAGGSTAQKINLSGTVNTLALTTPTVPPAANEGVNISPAITATASGGQPPYTFTSSLNSTNGNWVLTQTGATITITGSPNVAGNDPFTITVTDSGGLQKTMGATLPVAPIVPSLSLQTSVYFGHSLSAILTASGGIGPYTFGIQFPTSSGQWSITTSGSTVTLTGTPFVVGSIAYTLTATDSVGATGSVSSSFTASQEYPTPVIDATLSPFPGGAVVTYSADLVKLLNAVPGQPLPTGTVSFTLDEIYTLPTGTLSSGITIPTPLSVDILAHTITAYYSGDTNYVFTNQPFSYTVNGNLPQTISFTGGLNFPAGSTVALTAHATSGLPITYAVVSGSASIDASGANLVVSSPGHITVSASQPGDGVNFLAAPTVTASFVAY